MISNYIYLFFSFIAILSFILIIFNFKPNNSDLNNKILLKDLLEGLNMELPDELKALDNSSTDNRNLS